MGKEIERRFLVKNDEWRSKIISKEELSQAYLSASSDGWITRVRIIDNKKAYLTLKSSLNGFTNYEFEYQIPIHDALELLKLSKDKITKTRYQVKTNKKDWVVDLFHGSNSALNIAVIELNSDSEEIEVPSWCDQEITGMKSLSNASLAKTPISKLSVKDRMQFKES